MLSLRNLLQRTPVLVHNQVVVNIIHAQGNRYVRQPTFGSGWVEATLILRRKSGCSRFMVGRL